VVKAAVWRDDGTLEVVDRPLPEPRPGWVRVRVAAAGICGTDLHFFRGSFPSPAGLLPGHEVGGTVDAVGTGVDIAEGATVAVEPLVGCGRCDSCAAGFQNRCPQRTLFGISSRGGLAEYATVPSQCIHEMPAGTQAADGALIEPLAVCVRGIRLADVKLGDRVAVLGAGTIGLLSIVCARAAGAAQVEFTARHDAQRAFGRAFGGSLLEGGQFDVVIETVGGRADTLTEAVSLVRPGGTVCMLGVFDAPVPFPAFDCSMKEVRLVGSNCYSRVDARRDFDVALDLFAREGETVRAIVTHRFGLDQVNDAFATAADKSSGSVKVAIVP
jgi:threonine dehydrogenase-like Zn-dependent dehydrogenase